MVEVDGHSVADPNAIKLLSVVKDEDIESFTRQVSNLVSTDDIVTSSMERLLTILDPQNQVGAVGSETCLCLLCLMFRLRPHDWSLPGKGHHPEGPPDQQEVSRLQGNPPAQTSIPPDSREGDGQPTG